MWANAFIWNGGYISSSCVNTVLKCWFRIFALEWLSDRMRPSAPFNCWIPVWSFLLFFYVTVEAFRISSVIWCY